MRVLVEDKGFVIGERSGIWYKDSQISKLGYETCKDIIYRYFQGMLVLGYFSEIVLEDAQDLISGNEVHKMISLGRHCIKSEKRRERLEHKVGNLELPDFQYVKVPKESFCSTVRATSRVHSIYTDSRKF